MSLHSVICKILRSRASAHLPMNGCGCRFSRPCLEWRHRIFHSRRWSDCTGQAYTSQDCPWSQWNGLNASKVELENVLSVLAGVIIEGGGWERRAPVMWLKCERLHSRWLHSICHSMTSLLPLVSQSSCSFWTLLPCFQFWKVLSWSCRTVPSHFWEVSI